MSTKIDNSWVTWCRRPKEGERDIFGPLPLKPMFGVDIMTEPRRKQEPTKPKHERNVKICRDYQQGMTQADLSRKYSISRTLVGIILFKYGIHGDSKSPYFGRFRHILEHHE